MLLRGIMSKIEYFDYQKLAKEKKIPYMILRKIIAEVRHEFPKDKMMFELHMLRAVNSGYRPN